MCYATLLRVALAPPHSLAPQTPLDDEPDQDGDTGGDDTYAWLSRDTAPFRATSDGGRTRVLYGYGGAGLDAVEVWSGADSDDDSDSVDDVVDGVVLGGDDAELVVGGEPDRAFGADVDAAVREWSRRLLRLRIRNRMSEKVGLAVTEAVRETFREWLPPALAGSFPRDWLGIVRR